MHLIQFLEYNHRNEIPHQNSMNQARQASYFMAICQKRFIRSKMWRKMKAIKQIYIHQQLKHRKTHDTHTCHMITTPALSPPPSFKKPSNIPTQSFTALSMRRISTSLDRILNFSCRLKNGQRHTRTLED